MNVAALSLGLGVALAGALALQDEGGPSEPALVPPLGLAATPPEPEANPFDRAKWELGRALFFEKILSADRSVACADCHAPERSFADVERFSRGVGGLRTERNAPALLNRGFGRHQMWDGRASSLEEQVLLPIENPREMGLALDEALARLAATPSYVDGFARAFGGPPTREGLSHALAQFVRRLLHGDTAIDHMREACCDPLTSAERVGLWLYESKAGCWRCHPGPLYTDEGFHATGIGAEGGVPEPGRGAITGDPDDRGRFKTPTLRGLAGSAPYMHDGSLATLGDVVGFYRRGGNPNSNLDPRLAPLELSDEEAAALVAFLGALSRPGEHVR